MLFGVLTAIRLWARSFALLMPYLGRDSTSNVSVEQDSPSASTFRFRCLTSSAWKNDT